MPPATYTSLGDSGGSLLMGDKLVGVASGYSGTGANAIFTYADLSFGDNENLIEDAINRGAKIGKKLPEAGEKKTEEDEQDADDDADPEC